MNDEKTNDKTASCGSISTELLECLLCHKKEAYINKYYVDEEESHEVAEVYCPWCAGTYFWGMDEKGTVAENKKHSNAGDEISRNEIISISLLDSKSEMEKTDMSKTECTGSILITLEITDPETVECYANDDQSIIIDLEHGLLMKMCNVVSIKSNAGADRPELKEN